VRLSLLDQRVDIIHKLELNVKMIEENERKLKRLCRFYIDGKCQAFESPRDCNIFGLTCKKYEKKITAR